MAFAGIGHEVVEFYRELEAHNSREWWAEHKAFYAERVRAPFEALAAELAAFGEATVFRPYRDVRFSADKAPYKTHQGLFVKTHARAGWYVQVDGEGLRAGGGCYFMDGPQLARYRTAVANDLTGEQLRRITEELAGFGYAIEGEKLATRPRGIAPDAPRLELLRHKSIDAMMHLGEPDWLATPEAAGWIGDAWEETRPLVEWLREQVGD